MNQTIALCTRYGGDGDVMTVDVGASMSSLPTDWINRGILSVVLPPGAQITMYRDVGYQNEAMTFANPASSGTSATFDLTDYTAQIFDDGAIYNPTYVETPGSFRGATAPTIDGVDYSYFTYTGPDSASALGKVQIYGDANGLSHLTSFAANNAAFESIYNDNTSSLLLPPGIRVTLYEDFNYSGASCVFYGADNRSSRTFTLCNMDGGKSFMNRQASSMQLTAIAR
ncbi:hypothetical protein [Paraburkholderia rhizosphaerae]|uniref:Beta/gamma crystallin n=1 Tax=Paraburkholderia rhizosphaerae TaxID=480658 RepID=A0A4R8LE83_9BURK|nr:hypothetical protein [Paraburkholderia rhizosphaerae]TDY40430.1 hypothetical protein BX592_12574 [Paraburkholderia rhizosphaerae]